MKSKPILSAIVAMAKNWVIGKSNRLPWHLPADLKRFKAITTGHPILMGRKTYGSIGKPLPNRINIVLTRDASFQALGCVVVSSVEEAVQLASSFDNNELFVIGGAEIYRQLLPYIQRIYLTLVEHEFDGDTFFPELNKHEWKEIAHETHAKDETNPYAYRFIILERISSADKEE